MDGRVYTPEDEIDELHYELGRARRRLHDLDRAPLEHRWTRSPEEWLDAIANQHAYVAKLDRELAGLIADEIADAEGFAA